MSKNTKLRSVEIEPRLDADTPERFAKRVRHLQINGQPLESIRFKLEREKELAQ